MVVDSDPASTSDCVRALESLGFESIQMANNLGSS